MAAVIRVKRRLDEEPSEALILNCKKRKLNETTNNTTEEDLEISSALLKFAGTVKEDENIINHLKKQNPNLEELKHQFKKHSLNIGEKLRKEKDDNSKKNRYKLINYFRSQNTGVNGKEKSEDILPYTIYDVSFEHNNDVHDSKTKDSSKQNYVYDLYYTNSDDFEDVVDDYVSIFPFNDPLVIGSASKNVDSESEDNSEDSNAENNWRNDYPDESDIESVNEADMVEAMEKIDISEDLLSSDEGEDGFVYSIDSEAAGFEEDVDESDVHRYGEQYARFKAKHTKIVESSSIGNDFYYGDIDEDEYYY